jgi:hypothetical protein
MRRSNHLVNLGLLIATAAGYPWARVGQVPVTLVALNFARKYQLQVFGCLHKSTKVAAFLPRG